MEKTIIQLVLYIKLMIFILIVDVMFFIEDNKITDIFNNISDKNLKVYDNEISKLNKISNRKTNDSKKYCFKKNKIK